MKVSKVLKSCFVTITLVTITTHFLLVKKYHIFTVFINVNI